MTPATTDQVVAYLVGHNYLLTALELFMEACEAGREGEVEKLHRLFRDSQRFPPEEVAKHNPSQVLSMQSAARERERRLSVLDYELKIAQEDLQELRRRSSSAGGEGSAQQELAGQAQGVGGKALGGGQQAGTGTGVVAQQQPGTQDGETSPLLPHMASPAALASPPSSRGQTAGPSPGAGAVGTPSAGRGLLTSAERQELLEAVRSFLADQGFKLAALTLVEEMSSSTPPRGRALPTPSSPPLSLLACYRAQQAQQELGRQLAEVQEALRVAAEEGERLRHALGEAQQAAQREQQARIAAEADREFAKAKLSFALSQQRGQAGSGLNGSSEAQPGNISNRKGTAAVAATTASQPEATPGGPSSRSELAAGSVEGPSADSRPATAPGGAGSASFLAHQCSAGAIRPAPNGSLPGGLHGFQVLGNRSSPQAPQRQPNKAGASGGADPSNPPASNQSAFSVLGVEGALDEVARSLPSILPHVLVPRRAELVPLLLAVCQEHPSPAARRATAGLLFDLIKRPSGAQRDLITGACATLAQRIGPARTALELLPHIEQHAHHECVERRLLVGEVLGRLAPLLPTQALGGLLAGAVGDLLEDDLPQVRAAAAGALAALAGSLPDLEAYPQVQSLVLRLGGDESGEVVEVLLQQVLPALLSSLASCNLLYTQFLPRVLSELQGVLQRCPLLAGTDEAALISGTALLRALPDQAQRHAGVLLQLYTTGLPSLRAAALLGMPGWAAAWADKKVPGGALQPACGANGAAVCQANSAANWGPPTDQGRSDPSGPYPLVEPGTPPAGCSGHDSGPLRQPSPTPDPLQCLGEGAGSNAGPQGMASERGELEELPAVAAAGGEVGTQQQPPRPLSLASQHGGSTLAADSELGSSAASSAAGQRSEDRSPLPVPGSWVPAQCMPQEGCPSARGDTDGLGRALTEPAEHSPTHVIGGPGAQQAEQGVDAGQQGVRRSLTVREGGTGLGGPSPSHPRDSDGQVGSVDPLGALLLMPLRYGSGAGLAGEGLARVSSPAAAAEARVGSGSPGRSQHSWPQEAGQGSLEVAAPAAAEATSEVIAAEVAAPVTRQPTQRSVAWEEAAFGAWAASEHHQEWQPLEYMAAEALPLLIRSATMVPPTRDTLQLRHTFAGAFRATCSAFGLAFTRDVAEPALLAAGAVPDWRPAGLRRSRHVAALAHQLAPSSTEAERAGRCMAVPMLLAGVLTGPLAASDVADCVRRLLSDGGTGSEALALAHSQLFVEAVRFSAELPTMQAVLLEVMWEAAVSRSAQARLSAALLAGALAPVLQARQVSRQLMPAIVSLAGDSAQGVCGAGMAAAAEVLRAFPSDQHMHDVLLGELSSVLGREGHTAELAMLRALGPAASSASEDGLATWLLQQAQLLLAIMHQRAACGRTPGQLAESANALFDTLRLLEAHEFTNEQAQLNFVATLQALQREGDFLEPSQRDALAAMIADHAGPGAEGTSVHRSSSLAAPPTLHSFLPGGRRAALPTGVTLATLAHRMGSGSRPAAAPSSTQEVPMLALGGGRMGAGSSSGGSREAAVTWNSFRGWQYGGA